MAVPHVLGNIPSQYGQLIRIHFHPSFIVITLSGTEMLRERNVDVGFADLDWKLGQSLLSRGLQVPRRVDSKYIYCLTR